MTIYFAIAAQLIIHGALLAIGCYLLVGGPTAEARALGALCLYALEHSFTSILRRS
jgi:hypothetical protein